MSDDDAADITVHVAWFSRSDFTNHTTLSNITWLSGSGVRISRTFVQSNCNINGFNGPKWFKTWKYMKYHYHKIKQL